MRKLLSMIAAGLVCVASPVSAQESQAESWGLLGEQALRFEGKVTDLLCAITGNCPADCGAGKRQLGLLRDDGVNAGSKFPRSAGAKFPTFRFRGSAEHVVGASVLGWTAAPFLGRRWCDGGV